MVISFCISLGLRALFAVGLMIVPFAHAQAQTTIPQTVEDTLHQMSDEAAVIFVGQVTSIHPHDSGAVASGFIDIDFSVDQAIRNCTTGGTYTLREWAGLWAGNAQRYQVGQRLLMMLRAPGPTGMSSPIGGMDGAIPIRAGGAGSLLSKPVNISQVPIADLRWLGAKLMHPVSFTLHAPMLPTPLTLPQQMSRTHTAQSISNPTTIGDDIVNRASVPVQQASVDTVVKLLISWQRTQHNDAR